MAIIDLRQADIFIKDGTVSTATTTTGAAAVKGATSITVASATGLTIGTGFTVAGGIEYYAITSVSGTTLNFAPGLVSNYNTGAAVLGISNMLEVHIGEGTLTYSEKRGVTYVLNRGHIYAVKLADDAPVEVSMQFLWEFLRSGVGEPPTVEEALKQIGGAVNWVSSDPDPCNPYCVDLVICYVPPCGDTERIALNTFRWESLDHDIKASTVDVKGNCNVAFADVLHATS